MDVVNCSRDGAGVKFRSYFDTIKDTYFIGLRPMQQKGRNATNATKRNIKQRKNKHRLAAFWSSCRFSSVRWRGSVNRVQDDLS